MEENKPIHAKPSYFAIMFEPIKVIALKYGYNMVIHGSLNRDFDLIAIPWQEELGDVNEMINEICLFVGGKVHVFDGKPYTEKPHGRIGYVIDIYRGGYVSGAHIHKLTYYEDPQTYIDISVILSR